MKNASYLLVDASSLPDVYGKVLQVKQLLANRGSFQYIGSCAYGSGSAAVCFTNIKMRSFRIIKKHHPRFSRSRLCY